MALQFQDDTSYQHSPGGPLPKHASLSKSEIQDIKQDIRTFKKRKTKSSSVSITYL